MMLRIATGLLVVLTACEGVVGEPGQHGEADAVVNDPNAPRVVAFSCDATAVSASVPVQCLVQATHPDGLPLRCALDPGDGQPVIDLGDCQTALNATIRFRTPGQTTLRLVVSDDEGRSSTRVVVIEVTGQPNHAPVISGLVATPSSGGAPLRTRLTFTVTEPEGDATTCQVDVGADGSVEHPGLDCRAGTLDLIISVRGSVPVKLTACDDLAACADATVTVTVLEPVGDLRISRIDWGQSVMSTAPRLVEGKPALLRVSALANVPNLPGVVVEVEVKRGGATLGRVTLQGPAAPPTTEALADLSKQYRTVLPREWVTPGIELSVRVDSRDAVPETDESNNGALLTPVVGRGNVLHLTVVPVIQGGLTGTPMDVGTTVTRVWPFKSVEAKTRAPYTFTGVLSGYDVNAWSDLLDDLAQVRAVDGSQRNYYGFPQVNYGAGIAGIGLIGQPVATGRDDSLQTAAHELGHNFGRPHAPCGGAAGADPNYPYPGARLGSWGWDGQRLINPTTSVDLMSYCSPEWVSDYNYGRVQQFAEAKPTMAEGAVLPRIAAVVIAGRVKGDVVELAPVYRLSAHLTAPVTDGALTLRLVTARGAERLVPVELWEAEDDPSGHFLAVVEDPGELASLEVRRGATVLLARQARAAAAEPDVSVTRAGGDLVRVKWNAAAWPTAALAQLTDTERTTLALRLGGGEALVHTGSAGGTFEVSVSDGLTSRRVVVTP